MIDLEQALEVATDAAKKAGKRITEGFHEDSEFSVKGDTADRVTQTDIDAQNIIFETLSAAYPHHTLIGEEQAETPEGASAYQWIVDPLDGTMNFTHKLPFFGVSIALEKNGEGLMGVLYFPMLDALYTAMKGMGAKKNGQKINVRDCKSLENAMIAEIFSDRETRGQKISYPPSAAYRKFGSAITSAAFVAEGAVDGTILRCARWDIAAATVIIHEAGGTTAIQYDDESDPRSSLTFIASNPSIHESLCTLAEETIGHVQNEGRK